MPRRLVLPLLLAACAVASTATPPPAPVRALATGPAAALATAPPAPAPPAPAPVLSPAPPAPAPVPSPAPADLGPIVALGDSLTYGFGVTNAPDGPPPAHSYPWDMARDLGIPVVNAGISGTTAHELLDPASDPAPRPASLQLPALLALHPRLMIVEFGTNEANHHWPISRAVGDFAQLLSRIAGAHIPIVLVGTHVDCTVEACVPAPPGFAPQVYTAAWDVALRGLAAQFHAGLVLDVEHGFTAADLTDWIHCTAQGYQLMADRIEVAVRTKLG